MELYYNYDNFKNDFKINEYLFLSSCELGNLDLINWLMHFDYNLNINFDDNLPFQVSCINNNLDIAKLIAKKNNFDIQINDNNFIYEILYDDNFIILEWLNNNIPNIFKNLSYEQIYLIFKNACYYDIKFAKLLYNIFPDIPIYINNNKIFIELCNDNKIDSVYFLMDIRPNCYYIEIIDDIIINYEIINNLIIDKYIKNIFDDNLCIICLENNANIITECKHLYCLKCIETHYIVNNVKCPYCRKHNYESNLFYLSK